LVKVLRIRETPTRLPVEPPPEVAAAEPVADVAPADEPAVDEPAAEEPAADVPADVAAVVAADVAPAAGLPLLLDEQAARPAAAVTARATAPMR
jgi:fused signal recognition particle receptor